MSARDDAERLGELESVAGRAGGQLANLGALVDAVRRFYAAGATDDDRGRALIDSYRELSMSARSLLDQQLVDIEAVLAKIPASHPEREAVLHAQRTFRRQCAGLARLREFLDSGDERLLMEAKALLTVDDAGQPVVRPESDDRLEPPT